MALRVLLLGNPIVITRGAPLVVDTRKAIAILAYLACASGPVPRDTLSFLLWPDYAPDRSRAALRRTLSALRKGLGEGVLVTNRMVAALAADQDIEVDAEQFDAALSRLDAADPFALESAVQLYRGEFMAGFSVRDSPEFDDWQQRQAAHYRRLAASALDRLALVQAEAAQFDAAVATATRRLELDVLHEPAHRRLMMLNATSGNRPAAIVQYQNCVRILDEELGVAPLDETTDLYRRILDGSVQPSTAVAEPVIRVVKAEAPRPGFVGRERELEVVTAARVESHRSLRVLFITGEPGLGKTRLVDEFAAALEPEVGLVRARCFEGEAALAHSGSVSLLRSAMEHQAISGLDGRFLAEAARLVPDILEMIRAQPAQPPLDSPGGYLRLIEAVGEVLMGVVGAEGPGVLVLDDAHWADEASLQMLARIVRVHSNRPGLIIIAHRGGGITADHPLSVMLREVDRSGVGSSLELSRLSASDIAELVRTAAGDDPDLAGEVYRLSEGVPLFAVEYLAMVDNAGTIDSPPQVIRDLLAGLVSQRSELAVQLLETAAVIGRSFGFEILRDASGRTDEEAVRALDELLASHLIREAEAGVFDFDHDRIRAHVYDSMSLMRRRMLHRRVASAMRADDAGSVAATARHLLAAGLEAEAADRFLASAEAMARIFANEQALRHYEAALALGHPDVGSIREAIADLLAMRGDYAGAITHLTAAAGDADAEDRARMAHKAAVVHTRAGDWHLADRSFEEASGLMEVGHQARLRSDWAWLWHRRGDDHRARELAESGLVAADGRGDREAAAQALNVLGIIERRHDTDASLAHHERSLALVAEGDVVARVAALNNLALTHLAAGDADQGLGSGLEALQLVERIGDRHKTAAIHSNVADLLRALGRDEEAMRHLRISAATFAEIAAPGSLQPEIWMLSDW